MDALKELLAKIAKMFGGEDGEQEVLKNFNDMDVALALGRIEKALGPDETDTTEGDSTNTEDEAKPEDEAENYKTLIESAIKPLQEKIAQLEISLTDKATMEQVNAIEKDAKRAAQALDDLRGLFASKPSIPQPITSEQKLELDRQEKALGQLPKKSDDTWTISLD
jgi:hypothetical protein